MRDAPIGEFDSGVGGLTVLCALIQQMPGEHFIYLRDTARLPYGRVRNGLPGRFPFLAIDSAERFARVGSRRLTSAEDWAATRRRFPDAPPASVRATD